MNYLLDASAVLALLQAERFDLDLEAIVPGGRIASVNVTEVLTRLIRSGASAPHALRTVDALGLRVAPVGETAALRAGALREVHKDLSLGDRCCLAVAEELRLPVLTGEKLWKQVEDRLDVEVVLFR